jgi:hypothetical protein
MGGNDRGLGTMTEGTEESHENHSIGTARTKIWILDLSNTKQERHQLDLDVNRSGDYLDLRERK